MSYLLTKACDDLLAGNCVVIPTETVYGLAADATNDQAVAQIFAIKERPTFNPLIIHVATVEAARALVEFNAMADVLAAHFWPGPLTLVLPKTPGSPLSYLASAGLETIAIRIPAHPVALALLQKIGKPLAAPSANRSNTLSPTCAEDVVLSLGQATPLIIDAGPCTVGIESTIIDLSGEKPLILRPGGIEVERLIPLLGPVQQASADHGVKAPGMMKRHYAPQTPLRLNAMDKQVGEVMLGFGESAHFSDLNLSPTGDLTEAAANLFRMLRALDAHGAQRIAVMSVPAMGLGAAINDRLQRAAS
jgi:L-threonylcarbamoyladenylate synthase